MSLFTMVRMRKRLFTILLSIFSGFGVYLFQRYGNPSPNIEATLIEPVQNPSSGTRIQVFVLKNDGAESAQDIEIRMEYPKAGETMDYYCDSSPLRTQPSLRTQSELFLSLKSLVPGELLECVLSVPISEICPHNVSILYAKGVIDSDRIQYVASNKRRCK